MSLLGTHKKFLYAVGVLVGAMVGVGIFGMPYAFSKSGFWFGMGFLVLICLSTLMVDLMYGEVVLRTHEQHQMLGYTKRYLGSTFSKVVFFTSVLTGYVGLLAYIIISGDFLTTLLSPFFYTPMETYSIVFGVVLSLIVLRGLKTVSWLELSFSGLFIAVVALIFAAGFRAIDPAHFHGFDHGYLSLPYGVILFAFAGIVAIPMQREVLRGEEGKMPKAIVTAVLIAAGLYALFTTTVVGISGTATTPDAISGLYGFLGSTITTLGAVFGILAVMTSFMMLASGMIEIFNFDFGIKRFNSWLLVIVPPMLLFLAGIRTFVDVVSLAGGVSIGLEQVLIVFLYARAKSQGNRVPEYSLNIPTWLLYLVMFILSSGVVYFIFIR